MEVAITTGRVMSCACRVFSVSGYGALICVAICVTGCFWRLFGYVGNKQRFKNKFKILLIENYALLCYFAFRFKKQGVTYNRCKKNIKKQCGGGERLLLI